MANRLAGSASPYLRRHAENPVDWYPWGEEALARAAAEDKPIFLSIGFSTCHWCHVMARESFSDEAVAGVLNERFVCVKVDRDERPDLDRTYLEALRQMTGRAGWPATLLLTPALEPFFGGTYFPPEERDGVPGLRPLLVAIDDAWRGRRDVLEQNARRVTERISARGGAAEAPDPATLVERAAGALAEIYDRQWGGLGRGPKFPAPPLLEFLQERGRGGDADAAAQLDLTLRRMALGAVYDQVGGGFHRYAVDRRWRIPHFEKTLADNALLARAYLNAWKTSGDPLFGRVARETLDYLLRELRHDDGAFGAGQDAESDGREGGFYVWSFEELTAVVGVEAALALGASPAGNWEGTNVLWLESVPAEDALASWRASLTAARAWRARPFRDDKVIAAWNALAAIALAEAGPVLGEGRYTEAAVGAIELVASRLRRSDGRLMRSWSAGRADTPGFLDDYAAFGLACLALHAATLDSSWLERALTAADDVVRLFGDPDARRLFLTGSDVETALGRPLDAGDIALPSATSLAAELLWRTAWITGADDRRAFALDALGPLLAKAGDRPEEHLHALTLLGWSSRPGRELALIGDPGDPRSGELASVLRRGHFPEVVFAAAAAGREALALIDGREAIGGRPTAYLCEGMTCYRPTTDPAVLARQLSGSPQ